MMITIRIFHITALSAMLTPFTAAPQDLAALGDLDALNANIVGGYMMATAVQPDGKTIIGGRFTSVLGVAHNNIARLSADGTLDTGWPSFQKQFPSNQSIC